MKKRHNMYSRLRMRQIDAPAMFVTLLGFNHRDKISESQTVHGNSNAKKKKTSFHEND